MPSRKKTEVGKRRKPASERKDATLLVRVTTEQKRILAQAAGVSGLDVSSWLRALGMDRARALGVE